jgi:hypothetical protein
VLFYVVRRNSSKIYNFFGKKNYSPNSPYQTKLRGEGEKRKKGKKP